MALLENYTSEIILTKSDPTFIVSDTEPMYIKVQNERQKVFHDNTTGIIIPFQQIVLTYTAAEYIAKHRVVLLENEKLIYFDPTNATHIRRAIGITVDSISKGTSGGVLIEGELRDDDWNFDTSQLVYAGGQGTLLQIPPSTGFTTILGIPTSPTSFLVRMGLLFRRAQFSVSVTNEMLLDKVLSLPQRPIYPVEDHMMLRVASGPIQHYGIDYTFLTEQVLSWNPNTIPTAQSFSDILAVGDILQISYLY